MWSCRYSLPSLTERLGGTWAILLLSHLVSPARLSAFLYVRTCCLLHPCALESRVRAAKRVHGVRKGHPVHGGADEALMALAARMCA